MCFTKDKKRSAFTLAEVLITLTVVGVIAAVTIPILIGIADEHRYKSAWKKKYSEINQAIKQIYAEDNDTYSTDDYPASTDMKYYFCKIQKHMKILKSGMDCSVESTPTSTGETIWESRSWKLKDGTSMDGKLDSAYTDYALILNDGSFVQFDDTNTFWVDVNGNKGPNTVGKDIYYFFLSHDDKGTNKTYFWGTLATPNKAISDTNFESDCKDAVGTGLGCSAKCIIEDEN